MLAQALDEASSLGARHLVAEADAALRTLGVRPSQRPTTGIDALTASERRVADLAATGLTNRDIAQSLFLTLKTVENHLTVVYRKLGIAARTELAASLATGGV